jgi:hypothetical protein
MIVDDVLTYKNTFHDEHTFLFCLPPFFCDNWKLKVPNSTSREGESAMHTPTSHVNPVAIGA